MMDNRSYDLMNQIVEESRSLQRIRDYYGKDAADCENCKRLWDEMQQGKEVHLQKLGEELKSHI